MTITSLFFFINNYFYNFIKSLDAIFFIDLFLLPIWNWNIFEFFTISSQEFIDGVLLNGYFLLTTGSIFYILFSLFKNMFFYSWKYFVVNFTFDLKQLLIPNKNCLRWDKSLLRRHYAKPFSLPYFQADTMLSICLVVMFLFIYNFLLYSNILFLNLPQQSAVFFLNCNFLKWISLYFDILTVGFLIDYLSILMLIIVLFISTLVHYYSIDYMATDPRLLTFLKYLSGFTLAMVILVLANNLALLFLGWEGVGIFSYLLIGFWYTRTLALKASLKAVIVNRIGDVSLIISCGLILHCFGTLEFKKLQILLIYLMEEKNLTFNLTFEIFEIPAITIISIFLLIAAVGKSAQFGLHTWLPDAMEGPTPVSALIHAATMVTAGVYLIVRMSFFFEYSDLARNLTLIIGAFTALFGSIVASFQYDIKWIVAFSTCSQLGYMFLACGLSAYNLAMFHLFIHAFFKALLFLCAGSVIHAIGDEQDIWRMGGLFRYLPITYAGLCVGFFSLAGLPFTSGFFSKDTIIELAMTKRTIPGIYAYICASLAAWFTAFYSVRFFFFVIFTETKLSRIILTQINEHGKNMLLVITILTLTTICIGGITKNPLTSSFSFIFFSDSIFVKDYNFYFNAFEIYIIFYAYVHDYVVNYMKFILFIIPFFASYLAFIIFWSFGSWVTYDVLYDSTDQMVIPGEKSFTINQNGVEFYTDSRLQKFFETKGSTDQVYNFYLVKPILDFSYFISYKELDRGWLEYFFIKMPTIFSFLLSKNFNQNFGSLKLNFLPTLWFMATLFLGISINVSIT